MTESARVVILLVDATTYSLNLESARELVRYARAQDPAGTGPGTAIGLWLEQLIEDGSRETPPMTATEAETGMLRVAIDAWLAEVGYSNLPDDVKALRDGLFVEATTPRVRFVHDGVHRSVSVAEARELAHWLDVHGSPAARDLAGRVEAEADAAAATGNTTDSRPPLDLSLADGGVLWEVLERADLGDHPRRGNLRLLRDTIRGEFL